MPDFIEIDFVECGEKDSGDAIAIRHRHTNKDWIYVVDGGYKNDGSKMVNHIRKYYGNPDSIKNVVLTHPETDHASGLEIVLNSFSVECLWMNRPWNHIDDLMPKFKNFQDRKHLISRLKRDFPNVVKLEAIANQRGIEIRDAFAGTKIGVFTVLSPWKPTYLELIAHSVKTPKLEENIATRRAGTRSSANWGDENLKGESPGTSHENESSIVQFACVCNKKILLTGDAGVRALAEAHQVAKHLNISTSELDVFHVPHHGSRRNLSSNVLNIWLGEKLSSPSENSTTRAIISANRKDEEHPKKAVIRALIHRGRRVIQTKGTLRVCTNGAPYREGWYQGDPLQYPEDQEL